MVTRLKGFFFCVVFLFCVHAVLFADGQSVSIPTQTLNTHIDPVSTYSSVQDSIETPLHREIVTRMASIEKSSFDHHDVEKRVVAFDAREAEFSRCGPFVLRYDSRRKEKQKNRTAVNATRSRTVYEPVDEAAGKFNFASIDKSEILRDVRLAGAEYIVAVNKFPLVANHMLLVSSAVRPQLLTPRDIKAGYELSVEHDFRVLYNGWNAGASVNHFHFQFTDAHFPIESWERQAIGEAHGVAYSMVEELPVTHLILESVNFEACLAEAQRIVGVLIRHDIPHDLFMSGGRIYIFAVTAEATELLLKEESADSQGDVPIVWEEAIGASDLLGLFTAYRDDVFHAANQGSLRGLLRQVSADPDRVYRLLFAEADTAHLYGEAIHGFITATMQWHYALLNSKYDESKPVAYNSRKVAERFKSTDGRYDAHFHPLRKNSVRDHSTEFYNLNVVPIFDPTLFNFTKIKNPDEKFCEISCQGMKYDVLTNKYPIFDDHLLITAQSLKPQVLGRSEVDLALRLNEYYGLTAYFNSWQAASSVNHFHLQAFSDTESTPLSRDRIRTFARYGGVDVGFLEYREGGNVVLRGGSHDERISVASGVISAMQEKNIPHNVLFEDGVIYIFPRKIRQLESGAYHIVEGGAAEMFGVFVAFDDAMLEQYRDAAFIREYFLRETEDFSVVASILPLSVRDAYLVASKKARVDRSCSLVVYPQKQGRVHVDMVHVEGVTQRLYADRHAGGGTPRIYVRDEDGQFSEVDEPAGSKGFPMQVDVRAVHEQYRTNPAFSHISLASAGNVMFNDYCVAFDADDGQVYATATEPIEKRVYHCLVQWRSGRISSESLRFKKNGERYSVVVCADTGDAIREITDKIEWAVSGQRVVHNAEAVDLVDIHEQFDDLFHLFSLPQKHTAERLGGPDVLPGHPALFYRELNVGLPDEEGRFGGKSLDKPLVREALMFGVVDIDISAYDEKFGEGYVAHVLAEDELYYEVESRDGVVAEGAYYIDGSQIYIALVRSKKAHTFHGVTADGEYVSFVVAGDRHSGTGMTPEEAARYAIGECVRQGKTLDSLFAISNGRDAYRYKDEYVEIASTRRGGAYASASVLMVVTERLPVAMRTYEQGECFIDVRPYDAVNQQYDLERDGTEQRYFHNRKKIDRPRLKENLNALISSVEENPRLHDVTTISNGNLYHNDHFIVYSGKDGVLYSRQSEPIFHREYTCMVVWNDGRVSGEVLRFVDNDGVVQVYQNDDESKSDISSRIRWAMFGQRLIADGEMVPMETFRNEFDDLFQLFAFPEKGGFEEVEEVDEFGNVRIVKQHTYGVPIGVAELHVGTPNNENRVDGKILERSEVGKLLRGEAAIIDVSKYESIDMVREALEFSGYVDVGTSWPKKNGEYRVDGMQLTIMMKRKYMSHSLVAITHSGAVHPIVLVGDKTIGVGYTPETAREYVASEFIRKGDPVVDVFLVSNGRDAFMRVDGTVVEQTPRRNYPGMSCAIVFAQRRNDSARIDSVAGDIARAA